MMSTTLKLRGVLGYFIIIFNFIFIIYRRGSLAIFSFNGLYDLEEYNI